MAGLGKGSATSSVCVSQKLIRRCKTSGFNSDQTTAQIIPAFTPEKLFRNCLLIVRLLRKFRHIWKMWLAISQLTCVLCSAVLASKQRQRNNKNLRSLIKLLWMTLSAILKKNSVATRQRIRTFLRVGQSAHASEKRWASAIVNQKPNPLIHKLGSIIYLSKSKTTVILEYTNGASRCILWFLSCWMMFELTVNYYKKTLSMPRPIEFCC